MSTNQKNLFLQPVPQPPRRLSPESISTKGDEVDVLAARLDKAGTDLDAAVAEISVDLTDVARGRRELELRGAFGEAVAPLVAKLVELRDALEAQAPYYTREAVRSRATFGETSDPLASAQLGAYWHARVGKAGVVDLLEIARAAAGGFDLALCLAVEGEVAHRGLSGDDAEEIVGLCASVPTPPQDAAAARRIGEAWGVAEQARLTVEERATGTSRSVERMNAAFAAAALVGKPKAPASAPAVEVAELVPA